MKGQGNRRDPQRYPAVNTTLIYNSQDIIDAHSRRMDKEAVVHIHHAILLSH